LQDVWVENFYFNFPAQIAKAMEFERGEVVEWFVEDKRTLALRRTVTPEPILKKTGKLVDTFTALFSQSAQAFKLYVLK